MCPSSELLLLSQQLPLSAPCPCLQRAADGRVCKVTSCWEGRIHKATLQCERYAVESWRLREGRMMAVRSDLQMADGRRATLLWFLEQVAVPNKPRGCLPCEPAEGTASGHLLSLWILFVSVVVLAKLQVSLLSASFQGC